jgi:hypothetical protein
VSDVLCPDGERDGLRIEWADSFSSSIGLKFCDASAIVDSVTADVDSSTRAVRSANSRVSVVYSHSTCIFCIIVIHR